MPFTLPGERVLPGPPPEIVVASPDRVAPACAHFGTCGGCALQHWAPAPYRAWKRELLVRALARAGYPDAPVGDLVTAVGGRRRVDLAIRRRAAAVSVGLHARGRGEIIDMRQCPVLDPALLALLPPLRDLLNRLTGLKREGSAVINRLDGGPDLLLRTDAPLDAGDRTRVAAFAETHGLPRIAHAIGNGAPEPAALRARPTLDFAGVPVTPPPGAFLQATRAGEAAIRDAVLEGLPTKLTGKARIAELYAGCGTLTFPLATRARVAAYEGAPDAIAALESAARAASLVGRIETFHRDLVRQPLSAKELAPFAAVVLDPPFAGAGPQMAPLAAAKVPRVIYVSCHPAALARDAATLKAAGYALLAATPIDQFPWSPHLESVMVFARK